MILLLLITAIASGIAATKHGLLLSRALVSLQSQVRATPAGVVLITSGVITARYTAFKGVQTLHPCNYTHMTFKSVLRAFRAFKTRHAAPLQVWHVQYSAERSLSNIFRMAPLKN